MIAKPGPSPAPTNLHLNLQHLHVSGGLVIAGVVLILLGILAASAARHRTRAAAGARGDSSGGWGNLSGGQDVAIILLILLFLGGMAYVLPFGSFIFVAVVIGIAAAAFTVLRIACAGPLIAKWRRGVNEEGEDVWRQIY